MADEQTIGIKALVAELKSGNAERRVEEAAKLQRDKLQLEKMEEQLKETGIEAKDSQKYRDEELRIKKAELALRKQGATSKAAREEIAKEESELQSNRFEKFFGENSFVGKSLGGLGDKLGNLVPGGVKGILGTLGTVAALGALVTFLQSETWKNLKEKIIPKLAEGLEAFINSFSEFFADITTFFEDPSFANFTEIFTGKSGIIIAGLVGITALLSPFKTFRLLKLGIIAFKAALNLLGKGLPALITGGKAVAGGVARAAGGVASAAGGVARAVGGGVRAAGGGIKSVAPLLKVGLRGAATAAKFIPGLGLVVTAAMGIFDGMAAGIEEYKKSGELGKSVEAGISGAASGLTFGLVSQETFQKGIDGIQAGLSAAWKATTDAYDSVKTGLVAFYNEPAGTFKLAKAAITKSVSETANKLKGKFEEITGIELPSFADIKTKMTAMKTSFESVTGLKLPTFADLQTKFTELSTKLSEIKLPTFADLKLKFTEFGTKISEMKLPTFDELKTKFTELGTKLSEIKLPTFADLKTKFTELSTKLSEIKLPTFADLKTKFTELGTKISGMKVPSFADVGTALAKFRTDTEELTGIKLPSFTNIKAMLEDKFSFNLPDINLPEFPDIGEIVVDIFRKFAKSLASIGFNIPVYGRVEFSDLLPQSFLDFANQTGSFAPQPPSRSAESIQQSEIDRFLRMGNTVVQMNGGNTNNSSTQVVANRDTQVSREMQALLSGQ